MTFGALEFGAIEKKVNLNKLRGFYSLESQLMGKDYTAV